MESIKGYFEAPEVSGREKLLTALQKSLQELHASQMPSEKGQSKRLQSVIVELALIRTVLRNSNTFPLVKEDSCR